MKLKEIKEIINSLSSEELEKTAISEFPLKGDAELDILKIEEDWYMDDESPFPESALEPEHLKEMIELETAWKIWSKGDIFFIKTNKRVV